MLKSVTFVLVYTTELISMYMAIQNRQNFYYLPDSTCISFERFQVNIYASSNCHVHPHEFESINYFFSKLILIRKF